MVGPDFRECNPHTILVLSQIAYNTSNFLAVALQGDGLGDLSLRHDGSSG